MIFSFCARKGNYREGQRQPQEQHYNYLLTQDWKKQHIASSNATWTKIFWKSPTSSYSTNQNLLLVYHEIYDIHSYKLISFSDFHWHMRKKYKPVMERKKLHRNVCLYLKVK